VPDILPVRPLPASNSYKPGDVFRDCPECPELVVVPAGSFTMGSPPGEVGRYPAEGPQRRVTIARPLAAGRHEVTFAEWDACVGRRRLRRVQAGRPGLGARAAAGD
jgi:formylglycine-generating enzyme required for sulfatase activity